MPKSSKKFILSNSGLNAHGFRMLTEGADLKEFKKNPIMLWMHNRAFRGTKDEVLPLGYWDDITIEGDNLTAVPVFDDDDDFAMSIYRKVENGTIRMCSAGAVPIQLSDDPKHLVPGQTRATFLKWKMKEASITDIGSNAGALAVALYDENDVMVKLSDDSLNQMIPLLLQQTENMKIETLTAPAIIALLKLPADSDEAAVISKINDLVTLSAKLDADKKDLSEKLEVKVQELADLQKTNDEAKIETLVQGAVDARKITADEKAEYVSLAALDYAKVEKLLNGKVGTPTIQRTLAEGSVEKDEIDGLRKLSYDELFAKTGALNKLMVADPETYKLKFKDKFGTEPKNV